MDASKGFFQQQSNGKVTITLLVIGLFSLAAAFVIGVSDNPPGILLLLAGCFAILFSLLHNVGEVRGMKLMHQAVYWAPRTISIVFTALTSLFAADVFNERNGFWETSLALIMHLVPTFLLVGILVASWHREWIGGILFNVLAVVYVVTMWGRFPLSTYLLICGPLVVTGLLFLLNWHYRGMLKKVPVI